MNNESTSKPTGAPKTAPRTEAAPTPAPKGEDAPPLPGRRQRASTQQLKSRLEQIAADLGYDETWIEIMGDEDINPSVKSMLWQMLTVNEPAGPSPVESRFNQYSQQMDMHRMIADILSTGPAYIDEELHNSLPNSITSMLQAKSRREEDMYNRHQHYYGMAEALMAFIAMLKKKTKIDLGMTVQTVDDEITFDGILRMTGKHYPYSAACQGLQKAWQDPAQRPDIEALHKSLERLLGAVDDAKGFGDRLAEELHQDEIDANPPKA